LGRLPAEPVDVTADEEEDGHDLEKPGQPADPGDEGEEVAVNQLAVLGIGGGEQPVAEYDEAYRGGAQEIDVAVAFGRGLCGEAGGAGPDGYVYDGILYRVGAGKDGSLPDCTRRFVYRV